MKNRNLFLNRRKFVCRVFTIVFGLTVALYGTHAQAAEPEADSVLKQLASAQFAEFGKAIDIAPEELQNPQVVNYGTFVAVMTGKWIFRQDVSGNKAFYPVSSLTYISAGFQNPFQATSSKVRSQLIDRARNLTSTLRCDSQWKIENVVAKKEVLLSTKCSQPTGMRLYDGRYLVHLYDHQYHAYFQVIFDQGFRPMRIDTNISNDESERLTQAIFNNLRTGKSYSPWVDQNDKFVLSTFYYTAPGEEYRFVGDAKSYEGRPLPLSSLAADNPYKGDESWYYEWWRRCGRVNGLRGNWDEGKQTWQKPKVQVVGHLLNDYPVSPEGDANKKMPAQFYRDLESATIAGFFGHSGPIDNQYQLGKGQGWFVPGTAESKLGTGNLRHIIFQGCGAMGFTSEQGGGGYKALLSRWMRAENVDGLVSVSGIDGGAGTFDRSGWNFSQFYNQGDSIADSHRNSTLRESVGNAPVTVCYGETMEQAVKSLAEGRIRQERAEPIYAVASAWEEMDAVPTLSNPPKNAVWLDLLDVSKMVQAWGQPRPRVSLDGKPLQVGGKKYLQGIGTHAESKFAIKLKGAATRFTATVGLDGGGETPKGSVVFQVWIDNKLVAESPLLKGETSFAFDVDLTGAQLLGLRVTDGDDGINSDQADWCDAMLYLDPEAIETPEAIDLK